MSVKLVNNGMADGFMVRLPTKVEVHFPTATRVEVMPDGRLLLYNELICLSPSYAKGEFATFWRVQKERPKKLRTRTAIVR
jgi:hypothetical protein